MSFVGCAGHRRGYNVEETICYITVVLLRVVVLRLRDYCWLD